MDIPSKQNIKPKGGYHPKKTSGWGAVIGIIIAFLAALFMLHRGVRYVAMHYRYFSPEIQHSIRSPEAEGVDWIQTED